MIVNYDLRVRFWYKMGKVVNWKIVRINVYYWVVDDMVIVFIVKVIK